MTERVAKAIVIVEITIAFILLSILYDSIVAGSAVTIAALLACYAFVFHLLPRLR